MLACIYALCSCIYICSYSTVHSTICNSCLDCKMDIAQCMRHNIMTHMRDNPLSLILIKYRGDLPSPCAMSWENDMNEVMYSFYMILASHASCIVQCLVYNQDQNAQNYCTKKSYYSYANLRDLCPSVIFHR